jgi:hypothetical protein
MSQPQEQGQEQRGQRPAALESSFSTNPDRFEGSFHDYNSSMMDINDTASNKALANREEVAKLALQETRNVKVWRRNVILMILAMGALVTSLTYVFLRDEDQEDFETSVRILETKKTETLPCLFFPSHPLTSPPLFRFSFCCSSCNLR